MGAVSRYESQVLSFRALVLVSVAVGVFGVASVAAVALVPGVAIAQSHFVTGPYVDRLVLGTATVHVRTDTETQVHVDYSYGSTTGARDSSPGTAHAIVISGLPPDARVRYRVSADGYTTANGTFHTPPATGGGAVDFVALGDCRDGDAEHARIMRAIHGTPDFVLMLGDYVPTGSTLDEWSNYFRIAAPLLSRTAIIPVLGNHEIIAPMGRDLYRSHFALPSRGDAAYYSFDYGGVRVIVLDSNAPIDPGTDQFEFARRELERAGPDPSLRGLFVAIHQGPLSSGRHGELEALHTSGLVDAMREARVDLVLSGHDHMYERGDSDGLKYIVSGGCGSPLYRANAQAPYQQTFAAAFHFVRVTVSESDIAIDTRRADGSRIERCTFRRGGAFRCPRRRTARHEAGVSGAEDYFAHYGVYALVPLGFFSLVYLASRRTRGLA